jgi:hypothetical protein
LRRLDDGGAWLEGAKSMEKRNAKSYPDMLPETQKLLQVGTASDWPLIGLLSF